MEPFRIILVSLLVEKNLLVDTVVSWYGIPLCGNVPKPKKSRAEGKNRRWGTSPPSSAAGRRAAGEGGRCLLVIPPVYHKPASIFSTHCNDLGVKSKRNPSKTIKGVVIGAAKFGPWFCVEPYLDTDKKQGPDWLLAGGRTPSSWRWGSNGSPSWNLRNCIWGKCNVQVM